VLYIVVSAILAGIVPVTHYRTLEAALPGTPIVPRAESTAFLNAPVAYVLHVIDQDWAAGLISAARWPGSRASSSSCSWASPHLLLDEPRQSAPPGVSKVHPRFGTPYITTIITGIVVALFAAIIPIEIVGEMTSIGTLFAFVSCARQSSCCGSSGRGPPAVQGALRLPLPGPRRSFRAST